MGVPAYSIVTGPEIAPVSLGEAKLHLRVEHDLEDAYITQLVDAAREYVEQQWGLALIEQTHKVLLDTWPAGGVKLRPHPVASLVSVKAWNGSAFADITGFQLVTGRPAFVVLTDGGSAPVPSRTRQGIEITFTTGFAASEDGVPSAIKQAIMLLIGQWYENREAGRMDGSLVSAEIALGVAHLMAPYRSPRLA